MREGYLNGDFMTLNVPPNCVKQLAAELLGMLLNDICLKFLDKCVVAILTWRYAVGCMSWRSKPVKA